MTQDNPSAFACASENGHQAGITLRDYFAGQALAGLCASSIAKWHKSPAIAKMAYMVSDAMLAERGKSI